MKILGPFSLRGEAGMPAALLQDPPVVAFCSFGTCGILKKV
jgi:hypothetical protein